MNSGFNSYMYEKFFREQIMGSRPEQQTSRHTSEIEEDNRV